MVGSSQQLIYVLGVSPRRRVLPKHRQVRRYLPVEQGHLLQFAPRELAEPALVRLQKQFCQPVPKRPPLSDPLI